MFQTLKIKNILTNVLFVWSKLNPDISYRQGIFNIRNKFLKSLFYFTNYLLNNY